MSSAVIVQAADVEAVLKLLAPGLFDGDVESVHVVANGVVPAVTLPPQHIPGMPHGNGGFARGCRCDVCVQARKFYLAEYRREGRFRLVDAAPYRDVIRATLRQTREPMTVLAAHCGLDVAILRRIANGAQKSMRTRTAVKLNKLTELLPKEVA